MMNQVILVGRVEKKPTLTKTENGVTKTLLKLAVERTFKNVYGKYETDVFNCILWNGISNTVSDYVNVGDVIGIRGRLQKDNKKTVVIAERVTFLTSANKNEGKE